MKSAAQAYRKTSKQDDREKLVLDNVVYVGKILSTMTVAVNSAEQRENLESAGILGLVEAANNYDASRGVAFRTFAYSRIRGAIIDELRRLSPVSQQMLQQIGLLKKAYERLEPPVSPEMLSAETQLTLEQVYEALEAMRFLKPENWNDFDCVVHGSWKSQTYDPEHEVERQEMQQLLVDSIQQLPERERLVLTLYYSEDLNLAEIGKVLEISESRVSRILAAAKFRLKELVRSQIR